MSVEGPPERRGFFESPSNEVLQYPGELAHLFKEVPQQAALVESGRLFTTVIRKIKNWQHSSRMKELVLSCYHAEPTAIRIDLSATSSVESQILSFLPLGQLTLLDRKYSPNHIAEVLSDSEQVAGVAQISLLDLIQYQIDMNAFGRMTVKGTGLLQGYQHDALRKAIKTTSVFILGARSRQSDMPTAIIVSAKNPDSSPKPQRIKFPPPTDGTPIVDFIPGSGY